MGFDRKCYIRSTHTKFNYMWLLLLIVAAAKCAVTTVRVTHLVNVSGTNSLDFVKTDSSLSPSTMLLKINSTGSDVRTALNANSCISQYTGFQSSDDNRTQYSLCIHPNVSQLLEKVRTQLPTTPLPVVAGRSSIIIHSSTALTAFTSSTQNTASSINANVGIFGRRGFSWINNSGAVIRNIQFGSFMIVRNKTDDFRIQYKIKAGQVWSDGTPINGVDLFLSHVICSNAYSIDAGLGDPTEKNAVPAFDSICYSGPYSNNIVGIPVLSSDKMMVTLQFKNLIAGWDLHYSPEPFPVHTLALLARNVTRLQSVDANEIGRTMFYDAFTSMNTVELTAMGKVFSDAYKITEVNNTTNKLLFVGNGGFIVDSAVTGSSVTLKVNPKYNSGPALTGTIDTVIFKFIANGTTALEAFANGEVDVYYQYSLGSIADFVVALKNITNANVISGNNNCYEHWDTRVGNAPGQTEYTGLFKGHGGMGADLRVAFLLSIPREEIIERLIRPINPNATIIGSTFIPPSFDGYDFLIANNGASFYLGTQDELNLKASLLLKKHYPNASSSNPVKVNVLVPGNNARRAFQFAITKANALKVGFDLVGDVQASWSTKLLLSAYDAQFFAYCPGVSTQTATSANFKLGGTSNSNGINLPALDAILDKLQPSLEHGAYIGYLIQAERIIHTEGLTSGVFIYPTVTAVNKLFWGIKPNPTEGIVWNWWEWGMG